MNLSERFAPQLANCLGGISEASKKLIDNETFEPEELLDVAAEQFEKAVALSESETNAEDMATIAFTLASLFMAFGAKLLIGEVDAPEEWRTPAV